MTNPIQADSREDETALKPGKESIGASSPLHGMVCYFIDSYIDDYIDLECTDDDGFLALAEMFGVVRFREPTADEFADPNWFGHKHHYSTKMLCVCEKTTEFIAMVEAEEKEHEHRFDNRSNEPTSKDRE